MMSSADIDDDLLELYADAFKVQFYFLFWIYMCSFLTHSKIDPYNATKSLQEMPRPEIDSPSIYAHVTPEVRPKKGNPTKLNISNSSISSSTVLLLFFLKKSQFFVLFF